MPNVQIKFCTGRTRNNTCETMTEATSFFRAIKRDAKNDLDDEAGSHLVEAVVMDDDTMKFESFSFLCKHMKP